MTKNKITPKKIFYFFLFATFLVLPSLILSFYVDVNIKALVMAIVAAFIVGQIIEISAVRHGKKDASYVYEYSPKLVLGPKLFDTPIEDSIVFLLFTPIFIVFFYEFIKNIL